MYSAFNEPQMARPDESSLGLLQHLDKKQLETLLNDSSKLDDIVSPQVRYRYVMVCSPPSHYFWLCLPTVPGYF